MATVRYLYARGWALAGLALCLVVLGSPSVATAASPTAGIVSSSHLTADSHDLLTLSAHPAVGLVALLQRNDGVRQARLAGAERGADSLAMLGGAAVLLGLRRQRLHTIAGPHAATTHGLALGHGRAPPHSS
jgi:hypothetical protein